MSRFRVVEDSGKVTFYTRDQSRLLGNGIIFLYNEKTNPKRFFWQNPYEKVDMIFLKNFISLELLEEKGDETKKRHD